MSGPMVRRILGCLVLGGMAVGLPVAPAAQEVIGTITAELDGAPREWRTLAGDDTDYNTVLRDFGGILDISLHGYEAEGSFTREILVIDLSLAEGGAASLGQTVLYVADSMSRPWSSLEGEDVVRRLNFDADAGTIEGELDGRLCFKDGLFAEPDPETCIRIAGRFESFLPRAD
jgi:hypothetical protein